MRVAVVGPTFPFRGGIAHYTTLLCRAMRARHELLVISFLRQYPRLLFPGRTDRDESRAPLTLDDVRYTIDSLKPWTWWRAARDIQAFRPQKVVLQWWVSFWFPQLFVIVWLLRRSTEASIIIVCHNVVEHETSGLKKLLTRVLLRKADVLVTHSDEDAASLESLVGGHGERVAGFLPTFTVPGPDGCDRASARKALGLSGPVLLFFGFVRPYKGLHVLLDALPVVLAERKATLVVVGEFWKDKEAYLNQVRALGITSHVVVVDRYVPNEEVGAYFCAADLVVQPYLSATGSAVAQMAYGFDRPVVATRVGSLPEIVVDGENGFLVEPGDADGLARNIIRALDPHTLARLQREAAIVKQRFTWDRLTRLILGDPGGCE